MLARTSCFALGILLAATVTMAGCAAPTDDEGVDNETSNVTGGSKGVDSPVVYMFDPAQQISKTSSPSCTGAMLSDTMAVTAKACAKVGLVVGRATDKAGKNVTAKVKALHVPEDKNADIAVVELDKALSGGIALVTHMPLRDGYTVNSVASVDTKGLLGIFSPDKNDAASIKASILEEGGTFGSLTPAKGAEICDGDIGAPVCSSSAFRIAGKNLPGTCGLSGIVVGRMEAAAAPAAPAQPGAAQPAPTAATCSAKAWKVTSLGQHADFLKKLAPKAFEPLKIANIITAPYSPDGLWGYQTKGAVKSCAIETTKIDAVKAGTDTAKIKAKVAFTAMDKKATPFGRFGIAPKAEPTKMRWLPATALNAQTTASFETEFEGVVNADKDGDYLVAFRVSPNGGESWSMCDTDGLDNGFQIEKAVALKIGDAPAPVTPPAGGETKPQDQQPPAGGYQDPPAASTGSEEGSSSGGTEGEKDPTEDAPAAKKKTDNGGCSLAQGTSTSSSLPLLGAVLALAMVARRRRRSA